MERKAAGLLATGIVIGVILLNIVAFVAPIVIILYLIKWVFGL